MTMELNFYLFKFLQNNFDASFLFCICLCQRPQKYTTAVYFNQQTGALHVIHWSKSFFGIKTSFNAETSDFDQQTVYPFACPNTQHTILELHPS